MRIAFVYPDFDRHARSHPELLDCVPCDEYLGSPSLGIAMIAAATPPGWEASFHDDRVRRFDGAAVEADLYALSVFTPAATRAFEIADALRAEGKRVVMGGLFPTALPFESGKHADAIVVGEGETVWGDVCRDACSGRLRPRYEARLPVDLGSLAPPRLDLYFDAEEPAMRPDDYPLQLSRGCPLHCDACVLPLSMTSTLRTFPLAASLDVARTLARAGKRLCLTEDTSVFPFGGVRKQLREFLEAVVADGGEPIRVSYLGLSMPMVQNLDPTLLATMKRAGIGRFYLVCGFDDVTRRAFGLGDARAMARAEACVRKCHDQGIEPYTSLLVGNDDDDEGVFDRILEFTERTGIEKSEFTLFTPYPGTPAWRRMNEEGRIHDRTWKHYNDANVVFEPRKMTPERLTEGYLGLWREFYRAKGHLRDRPHADRTIQF